MSVEETRKEPSPVKKCFCSPARKPARNHTHAHTHTYLGINKGDGSHVCRQTRIHQLVTHSHRWGKHAPTHTRADTHTPAWT